jgi:hypothetical protein
VYATCTTPPKPESEWLSQTIKDELHASRETVRVTSISVLHMKLCDMKVFHVQYGMKFSVKLLTHSTKNLHLFRDTKVQLTVMISYPESM